MPSRLLQRSTEGQAKGQFHLVAVSAFGRRHEKVYRRFKMIGCRRIGPRPHRPLARALPVGNGLVGEPRLGVVVRLQFRFGRDSRGKLALQHLGDLSVIVLAGPFEQRLIGRVLHQCVLEQVPRAGRSTPLVEQLGVDQQRQAFLQLGLFDRNDRLHHLIGELPPEHGAELGDLADARQPVQPRHQRVLQGRGNGDFGERAGELVAVGPFAQEVCLQNGLGQFFDV